MLTDWRPVEIWDDFNRELTAQYLAEDSKEQLRLYQGAEHGVWEVTQGIARLFPHRRKVICFRNQDPFHDHSIFSLTREGFDLVTLPLDLFGRPDKWEEHISRETLLVLYSADDPLVGRSFPSPNIEEHCAKNGTFAVKVRHHDHRGEGFSPLLTPFCVEVRSYDSELACAHLGGKAKIGSMIAPFLEWCSESKEAVAKAMKQDSSDGEKRVKKMESSLPGGAQALWQKGERRSWDRAVFFWEDMDGHSVIHYLAEEMGWSLGEPGREARIETTSLSRWGGLRTMDWLKQQGLSANQVRGTVIVHHSVINDELNQALFRATEKVKQLQGS